MPRPTKLTPELQQIIGDGVSLGLTYSLAAESAGVTYKTYSEWIKRGRQRNLGNIISFINILKNVMLMLQKLSWNAFMTLLMQGIARFACGFWKGDSRTILGGGYIGK